MEKIPPQENQEGKHFQKSFHFEGVAITPENDFSFDVRVGKEPIEIHDGDTLGQNAVEVKFQDETLDLLTEAEKLQTLPEEERLVALAELIRSKLKYPYADVMENAQKENPDLAEWLEKRFGKNPSLWKLELNEFLKRGYGDCKIMATAYLAAAQSAKLKGIYANSYAPLKNLPRPDNGQPIFKSVEVGRDLNSPHAWVEVQMADGRWVPVDPTANMIGLGEMLDTFRDADYKVAIAYREEGLPNEVELNRGDSFFEPGESEKTLRLRLKSASPWKRPKADRYSGDVSFKLSSLEREDNKSLALDFKE